MQFANISSSLEVYDLRRTQIDLSTIENRRFMYHPAGWLILGAEDVVNNKSSGLLKSHAEEHYEASLQNGNLPAFDTFIRGWIGVGGSYKAGIIHFAPHILPDNIEMFDKAFCFIETALQNGFTKKAVLRGFPGAWEQPINKILPDVKVSLDQKIADAHDASLNASGNISSVKKSYEAEIF